MKKFYFFILLSAVVIPAISQQQKITDRVTIPLYTQNQEGVAESPVIMVHKGNVFNIEANFIASKKKSLLSKILKGAGAAAVAYQSEQLVQQYVEKNNEKGTIQSKTVNKNNWLLPVGAGIAIGADKLLPKITAQTTIRYQLYNNKNELVSTTNVLVTNTKKPFVINDKVTESGYLKVQFINNSKNPVNNGNIDITVAEPTVKEENSKEEITTAEYESVSTIAPKHINFKQDKEIKPAALAFPVTVNGIFNKTENQRLNEIKPAVVITKQTVAMVVKPVSNKSTVKNSQSGNGSNGENLNIKAVPVKKSAEPVKQQPAQPVSLPAPVETVLPEEIKVKEEPGESDSENDNSSEEKKLVVGEMEEEATEEEDDIDDDGDDDDDGGGGSESAGFYNGDGGGGDDGDGDDSSGDETDGGDDSDKDDDDDGYGEWFYYTDPNTGVTYAIQLDPGESGEIDGMEITRNDDGSYTYEEVELDVVVTNHTNQGNIDVELGSIGLGADVNSTAFESISVLTNSEETLKPILGPFSWAGIFAGGLKSGIDILRQLLTGHSLSDLPSSTWITLGLSFVTAAILLLGPGIIGIAMTQMISLLLSLGASIWDIWDIINNG